MLFSLYVFECFWAFSLGLGSSFKTLWPEKMLDMILIFLKFLRLILCPTRLSIFENDPCAFANNVYFASLDWNLYKYQLSPFVRVSFNGTISLLSFCSEDLSIVDNGVLKFPTMTVFMSTSFFKSSNIFFIYLGTSYIYIDSYMDWYWVHICK